MSTLRSRALSFYKTLNAAALETETRMTSFVNL